MNTTDLRHLTLTLLIAAPVTILALILGGIAGLFLALIALAIVTAIHLEH